ncbi:glycosyltransferase family 9 protein [Kushneria sinocarnis]|nr:glycosyltransferase family 9 protein [Kushneria sinocarnis]
MSLLARIRTNTVLKRVAQRAEKALRRHLMALIWRCLRQPEPTSIDRVMPVHRILLIRPNYRIGNALIMTPAIDAFRARFPHAELDCLVTDTTAGLFEGRPLDRCHALSRRAILRPWQFVGLLWRLRRRRYDLAVQVGSSSQTGFIFTRFIGSRFTMGMSRGESRWFDIEVGGSQSHAYELVPRFAAALGVPCRQQPLMTLTETEQRRGRAALQALGLAVNDAGEPLPFIALFVGGHLDKRFSRDFWRELIAALEAAGKRYLVVLGPEEHALGDWLKRQQVMASHGVLCQPQPLRQLAAMLLPARCLVTPDSGPMHLAAAVDVPVVPLVRRRKSLRFVPRGDHDRTLWEPSVDEVLECLGLSRRPSDSRVAGHVPPAAGPA